MILKFSIKVSFEVYPKSLIFLDGKLAKGQGRIPNLASVLSTRDIIKTLFACGEALEALTAIR